MAVCSRAGKGMPVGGGSWVNAVGGGIKGQLALQSLGRGGPGSA